jgi:ribose transport system permease protein
MTTTPTTTTGIQTWLARLRKVLSLQEIGVILILFVMGAAIALVNSNFLTSTNIFNVARAFSWIAVTGFGEILVIITGGIDLSVGSTMSLSGLIAAIAQTSGLSVPVSILAGLATGTTVGLVNGLLVSRGKLPAFIATLGTMSIARGICYGLTNGQPVQNLNPNFIILGRYDVPFLGFLVPLPVIFMLFLASVMGLFLSRTVWGYRIYAIGGNEQATRLSGINTGNIKLLVFTLAGLMAGIGGLMMTARLGVATPVAAMGYELDVIAAVFIGGASTSGGSGTILGVLIGAAIMQVLRNGLVLLGFPAYWQPAAIGLVILVSLMLDQLRRRH